MSSPKIKSDPIPYNAPENFDRLARLERIDVAGNIAAMSVRTARGHKVDLSFELVADDIWRWSVVPEGSGGSVNTGIVTLTPGEAVFLCCEETPGSVVLSGGELILRINRDPWGFCFSDKSGRRLFSDNPGDVDGLGRPFVCPMGVAGDEVSGQSIVFSFHLESDEQLFGLGEKFTPLNKVGQRIISWTQDAFGSTSERSHKNIPFLLSTRGYGLLLDTGALLRWDLGSSSCQSATVLAESSSLTGYVIFGKTPADILRRFTDLTGHAPIPPKWSFGLWVSSGGTYRDRKAMEALMDGLATHEIPADVVHVDPWWMKWRYYCDFRWDESAFPEPQQFIDALHSRGLKLCLWEHPYISVESDLYTTGVEKGYFLKRPDDQVYVIDYGLSLAPRPDGIVREATSDNSWNARVAIVDLTVPEALSWFQDLHRPLLRMGVDVFKTDFGEDIPADALFANGQTGKEMHNLYPLLYNEAVAGVTLEEKGYGLVWGRSGTAGSQRMPVCWSGDPAADFESLACTIRGGLSIGLSGIPFWSNDIGGYRGMPDPDLYARWAQFGLFCSHSRMHGDSPREPWHFGEGVTAIVRRYIELRYRLFPYLYSCAHEAHRTGMPVIRAMPLVFPADPNTMDKDFQFMLGPWVLVAPIFNRAGTRSIYLPEGEWCDYWTGQWLQGPRVVTARWALDVLPLYLRGGAMVPMMSQANRIPIGRIDPLIVDVYPSGTSRYLLSEDEGDTLFTLTKATEEYLLQWEGPTSRRFVFRVHAGRGEARIDADLTGNQQGLPVTLTRVSQEMIEVRTQPVKEGKLRLVGRGE
jgi:alpha-D-xyloside xylohydrolase